MEKAAKEVAPEITPAEEIKVATEEIVAEAKEEVKEAPSRLRAKLRQLAAVWGGANVRSSASGSTQLIAARSVPRTPSSSANSRNPPSITSSRT